jgi:hypothetical protein
MPPALAASTPAAVLVHHAGRGLDAQASSAEQEHFRIRLGFADFVAVDDDVEQLQNSEILQDDLGILAGRAERDLHAASAQLEQVLLGAAQDLRSVDGLDHLDVAAVFDDREPQLLVLAQRDAAHVQDHVQGLHAADALEALVLGFREIEAQAVGELTPSQVVELGRVDDHTVETAACWSESCGSPASARCSHHRRLQCANTSSSSSCESVRRLPKIGSRPNRSSSRT